MHIHRHALPLFASLVVLCVPTAVGASPHHSPDESAIVACHDTILAAARTLTSDIEGHLGRCLTHGLDCLTSSRNPSACCARVAARCDDDRAKISESAQEFENLVSARSCTRVPFKDVLAAEGLGFETLVARCGCLTPPVVVDSLSGFATCLRRLIEDDVIQRMVLVDAPRAREALACLGLDADFPAALQERPALCETCAASPTPSATSTPAATSTAHATAPPTSTAHATPPATSTAHATPSATSTAQATAAATMTVAATPSATATPAVTATPAATSTAAPTTTAFATATAVASATIGTTPTPPSATSTPVVATVTPTPIVATVTPTPIVATVTPSPVASSTGLTFPSPTAAPTPVAVCGNGILEGDEQCDGAVIDNSGCVDDICTCDDFCDGPGGTLSCNSDCTVNFSQCTAGGCSF